MMSRLELVQKPRRASPREAAVHAAVILTTSNDIMILLI